MMRVGCGVGRDGQEISNLGRRERGTMYLLQRVVSSRSITIGHIGQLQTSIQYRSVVIAVIMFLNSE